MLKVLLYGLATFMETGIGVWIFGQMFPKRKVLKRKQYFSMWLMYLWIMIGAYTYPKLFLHVNRIHGYLGCIIAFYLSGILGMTIFIVRCKEWDLIKIIGFILMLAEAKSLTGGDPTAEINLIRARAYKANYDIVGKYSSCFIFVYILSMQFVGCLFVGNNLFSEYSIAKRTICSLCRNF